MPWFGHKGQDHLGHVENVIRSFRMSPRTALILTALAFASATPSKAAIRVGPATYPDSEEQFVVAACRGLEAQSRQSMTADPPDDIPSPDSSSAWALSGLPFTLTDCRKAGYR